MNNLAVLMICIGVITCAGGILLSVISVLNWILDLNEMRTTWIKDRLAIRNLENKVWKLEPTTMITGKPKGKKK